MLKVIDIKLEVQPYTVIFHAPTKKVGEITYSLESGGQTTGGKVIKEAGQKSVSVKIEPSFELLGASIKYGPHPYFRQRIIKDFGYVK